MRAFLRQHRALIAYAVIVVALLAGIYRVETLALRNCRMIEVLKAQERAEALDDYANLDETLRLLKLERTPAIEQRARQDRDRKLDRFAAKDCR